MVGDDLGQMILVEVLDEAVFISPKIYGGVYAKTEKGVNLKTFTKVKGIKTQISYDELKTLLIKDNDLKIEQEKWYRDLSQGTIKIQKEIITIMKTENKREFIYSEDPKILQPISTRPFKIEEV